MQGIRSSSSWTWTHNRWRGTLDRCKWTFNNRCRWTLNNRCRWTLNNRCKWTLNSRCKWTLTNRWTWGSDCQACSRRLSKPTLLPYVVGIEGRHCYCHAEAVEGLPDGAPKDVEAPGFNSLSLNLAYHCPCSQVPATRPTATREPEAFYLHYFGCLLHTAWQDKLLPPERLPTIPAQLEQTVPALKELGDSAVCS